jgi:hypothetical protein
MPANPGGKTVEGKMGTRQKPPSSQQQSPPQASERITVALIPKAVVDLQSLQDRTGLSKTDLTNRAISLYEFIDKLIREGKEVLIRDPEENETQRVHLL